MTVPCLWETGKTFFSSFYCENVFDQLGFFSTKIVRPIYYWTKNGAFHFRSHFAENVWHFGQIDSTIFIRSIVAEINKQGISIRSSDPCTERPGQAPTLSRVQHLQEVRTRTCRRCRSSSCRRRRQQFFSTLFCLVIEKNFDGFFKERVDSFERCLRHNFRSTDGTRRFATS